jgi:hypothetical protein
MEADDTRKETGEPGQPMIIWMGKEDFNLWRLYLHTSMMNHQSRSKLKMQSDDDHRPTGHTKLLLLVLLVFIRTQKWYNKQKIDELKKKKEKKEWLES